MLVQIGSGGPTVQNIQESLNTALPLIPLLVVDGAFGPKTRQRVVDFQSQAGLVADGVVGSVTSKALVAAVIQKLKGFG